MYNYCVCFWKRTECADGPEALRAHMPTCF